MVTTTFKPPSIEFLILSHKSTQINTKSKIKLVKEKNLRKQNLLDLLEQHADHGVER
jgi:hypothetical protein